MFRNRFFPWRDLARQLIGLSLIAVCLLVTVGGVLLLVKIFGGKMTYRQIIAIVIGLGILDMVLILGGNVYSLFAYYKASEHRVTEENKPNQDSHKPPHKTTEEIL